MLSAIVADFAQVGDRRVVTTLDPRLREVPAVARLRESARIMWAESPEHERCLFVELARDADATLVIAPETGGVLAERRRMTDASGGRFLGPSLEAIELCGDKLRLCEHLTRHSLPTIPTSRLESFAGSPPYPFPLVVKPRDGAGSVDTVLISDAAELEEFSARFRNKQPLTPGPSPARGEGGRECVRGPAENERVTLLISPLSPCGRGAGGEGAGVAIHNLAHNRPELIVQPFISGRALSTASLIEARSARIDVLPLGEQRLTNDGRFGYRGGRIPAVDLDPLLAAEAADVIYRACQSLPGLDGWVGFDLIVASQAPRVRIVEVNPRLTTSYVGYRLLSRTNLAARMLACCEPSVSASVRRRVALAACSPVLHSHVSEEDTGGQAASGTREFRFVEFDADGTVRDI